MFTHLTSNPAQLGIAELSGGATGRSRRTCSRLFVPNTTHFCRTACTRCCPVSVSLKHELTCRHRCVQRPKSQAVLLTGSVSCSTLVWRDWTLWQWPWMTSQKCGRSTRTMWPRFSPTSTGRSIIPREMMSPGGMAHCPVCSVYCRTSTRLSLQHLTAREVLMHLPRLQCRLSL